MARPMQAKAALQPAPSSPGDPTAVTIR